MNVEEAFDMLITSDYPLDGNWTIDQLTDLLFESGIDITQFSKEECDQLLDMCIDSQQMSEPSIEDTSALSVKQSGISFGSSGRCWWCSGSGVVWSGGQNVTCSHCGGSGIGPE